MTHRFTIRLAFALWLIACVALFKCDAFGQTVSVSVDIDLTSVLARHFSNPCVGSIVGYRFKGEPGQTFGYAGEVFSVYPGERFVELIADRKRRAFVIRGQHIPLGDEVDQFGFVEAELPQEPLPVVRARR